MFWIAAQYDRGADAHRCDFLRDIVVANVALADWEKVLAWLPRTPWPVSYFRDHEERPLPSTPNGIVDDPDHTHLLRVRIAGQHLHCFFFLQDEIEFDLDARLVVTPEQAADIEVFMRALAELLQRDVRLCYETGHDRPISTYCRAIGRMTLSTGEDIPGKTDGGRRRGGSGNSPPRSEKT